MAPSRSFLLLSLPLLAACASPAPPDGGVDSHTATDATSEADGADALRQDGTMDVIQRDDGAQDRCEAGSGLTACNEACVDLRVDNGNCGECGRVCASDEQCSAARCAAACRIGAMVFEAGAANPENPCERCDPARSRTAWTALAEGATCASGRVCSGGGCVAGCFISGAFVADGALDPSNDCRGCVASATTSAFSARADGATCGAAQFCTAGACGPTWRSSMPASLVAVYGGSAASTADGRVVLFGGVTSMGTPQPIVQIYNPATDSFTRGPDAPYVPYRSCAVRARNGRIYVMGGQSGMVGVRNVAVFDPTTNTFAPGPMLPTPTYEHSCELGADGKIYVFAADDAAMPGALYAVARTYVLDPTTDTWTTGAPMPTPRQRTTAVTLRDGRIMVAGGNRGYIFGALSALNEIYNPATNAWTTGAPQPTLVHWNLAGLRSDGRVVITGGATASGLSNLTHVYDPALDRWAVGTPNVQVHYAGYMARTPDGRLYVLAGRQLGATMTLNVEALY
ncbi:MAG: hypothetical protein U0269_23150 [Polyangiales bacterium]